VPLYREHRVTEMLVFQARLHGRPRAEYRRRIPEVLERVGIAHRARSLVGRLSRGQRQRVGLAVALLPAPPVLILDEPTSGLDPLGRRRMLKLVRALFDRTGISVVLSTHILHDVEEICDAVVILGHGKLLVHDAIENLRRPADESVVVGLEHPDDLIADLEQALAQMESEPALADADLAHSPV